MVFRLFSLALLYEWVKLLSVTVPAKCVATVSKLSLYTFSAVWYQCRSSRLRKYENLQQQDKFPHLDHVLFRHRFLSDKHCITTKCMDYEVLAKPTLPHRLIMTCLPLLACVKVQLNSLMYP